MDHNTQFLHSLRGKEGVSKIPWDGALYWERPACLNCLQQNPESAALMTWDANLTTKFDKLMETKWPKSQKLCEEV